MNLTAMLSNAVASFLHVLQAKQNVKKAGDHIWLSMAVKFIRT